MNRIVKTSLLSLAAAGLLGTATLASAQGAVPATKAGEASTQTPAGEPNPTQRPSGAMPAARANVREGAVHNNHSQGNTTTPAAGEATTKSMGQPNATPAVGERSREEVRSGTQHTPRPYGDTGQRPDVPTNPKNATGTPK